MSNTISQTSSRIVWVDTARFLCIMCVMMSHLSSCPDAADVFYEPFYLMGFFFVSGYLYHPQNSFRNFVAGKIRQLLVPWFVFSNFNVLLSAVISFREAGGQDLAKDLIWNMLQIRGFGDQVWFVNALFVTYIPFYFIIGWGKNRPKRTILLSASLSLMSMMYTTFFDASGMPWGTASLPWHMEGIFQNMLWMVLGYYYRLYERELVIRFEGRHWFLPVAVVYTAVCYIPYCLNWETYGLEGILRSYLSSLLGVLFLILLSKRIPQNRYITYIGANTLVCFAFHGKIYTVLEKVLGKLPFYTACLTNAGTALLLSIGMTISISVLLIIPIWFINRYCPWLLGRRKEKKVL